MERPGIELLIHCSNCCVDGQLITYQTYPWWIGVQPWKLYLLGLLCFSEQQLAPHSGVWQTTLHFNEELGCERTPIRWLPNASNNTSTVHDGSDMNTKTINVLLVGISIILILHMRKVKPKKVKELVQPHTSHRPASLYLQKSDTYLLTFRRLSARSSISGVQTCLETKSSITQTPISRPTASFLRFFQAVNGLCVA